MNFLAKTKSLTLETNIKITKQNTRKILQINSETLNDSECAL